MQFLRPYLILIEGFFCQYKTMTHWKKCMCVCRKWDNHKIEMQWHMCESPLMDVTLCFLYFLMLEKVLSISDNDSDKQLLQGTWKKISPFWQFLPALPGFALERIGLHTFEFAAQFCICCTLLNSLHQVGMKTTIRFW